MTKTLAIVATIAAVLFATLLAGLLYSTVNPDVETVSGPLDLLLRALGAYGAGYLAGGLGLVSAALWVVHVRRRRR